MPARNRARQIEKRPHRNDATFSISEREGANLRNSYPPCLTGKSGQDAAILGKHRSAL